MRAKSINESLNELYGKGWQSSNTGYPFLQDKKDIQKEEPKSYKRMVPTEDELVEDLNGYLFNGGDIDQWIKETKTSFPELTNDAIDTILLIFKINNPVAYKEYKNDIPSINNNHLPLRMRNNIEDKEEISNNSNPSRYGRSIYNILKAIEASGNKGLRYTEMQKIAYLTGNPDRNPDNISRGFGSTNLKIRTSNSEYVRKTPWGMNSEGSWGKYLRREKTPEGSRYFMNSNGEWKLDQLKKKFEK